MRERETKLIVEPGVELPAPSDLVAGIGNWAVEEIDQDAVYFDTDDLRLTRSGVSLRYRSDDGWTVKLPESREGAVFVRQEHAFAGELGEPPRAASELVRAWARSSSLHEVAQLRTHRTKVHVYDVRGWELGEIDDDDVTVTVTQQSRRRFREVEVEMREDVDPQLVEALVDRLRDAGAGRGPSMSKIARALGEAALAPPDLVMPDPLDRKATLAALVRASIARSVQRLLDHDPAVRLSEKPEAIHQARVATRRLRSDLRTLRPVLDARWSEPLRTDLQWLGEQLGHVRDADVLLGLLTEEVQHLPEDQQSAGHDLIVRLRQMRGRDREALLDAMRSSRYSDLLERLVEAARAPKLRRKVAGRRASKSVGRLARRPLRRLRKAVKRLPRSPSDADLHEVRKRAKQARYAFEAIAPVTGPDAKRAAKRLAALQTVLGDHQDTVVAARWLGDAARDSSTSEVAFVAGVLSGSLSAQRRRLRERWRKVWKRVDRSA
jgi:CHAD domain-containing protein